MGSFSCLMERNRCQPYLRAEYVLSKSAPRFSDALPHPSSHTNPALILIKFHTHPVFHMIQHFIIRFNIDTCIILVQRYDNCIHLCSRISRTVIIQLIIFEGVIIFSCINTWAGVISLFPAFGSFIRTFCLWQSDMKLVRLSGITTAIFYGIYYIHYGSIFMICGYLLLFMTGIYSIWKNDIKNIEISTKSKEHIYQI